MYALPRPTIFHKTSLLYAIYNNKYSEKYKEHSLLIQDVRLYGEKRLQKG
jgi:hypothetical protein